MCSRSLEAWFHRNNKVGRPHRPSDFDTGSPRFHRVCIAMGSTRTTICRAITSARMAGRNDGWLTTRTYLRTSIKLPIRYGKPESGAVDRHRRSPWSLLNFQLRCGNSRRFNRTILCCDCRQLIITITIVVEQYR